MVSNTLSVGDGQIRIYPLLASKEPKDMVWHAKGKHYWNEFGELLSHDDRIEYCDLAAKIHIAGTRANHPIARRAQRFPSWASFILLRLGFGEHAEWASLLVGNKFAEMYSPAELVSPIPNYCLPMVGNEEMTIWKEQWDKIVKDTRMPFPYALFPRFRGSLQANGTRHGNPQQPNRHSFGNPSITPIHQAVQQSPSARSAGHSPKTPSMSQVSRSKHKHQKAHERRNGPQHLPFRPSKASSQVYRPGISYDIPSARTAAVSGRAEERQLFSQQHDRQEIAPLPGVRIPTKESKQAQIVHDDRLKTPKYVERKTRVPLPHESGLRNEDFEHIDVSSESNNSSPCQGSKPSRQQKPLSKPQEHKGKQRVASVPCPTQVVYISDDDDDENETTATSPDGAATRHRASPSLGSSGLDECSLYNEQQDSPLHDDKKKRRVECEGTGSPKKKKKSARSKEIAALKGENSAIRGERDAVRGESNALKEINRTLRKRNEDLEEEIRKLKMERERRRRGKTVG